jgi:hypothetical protein
MSNTGIHSIKRVSQKEACCQKVQRLREYLSDARLELWASNEDRDVSLWIACESCAQTTQLSAGS